jgi:HSP20 family protein
MSQRDPNEWMWERAAELLERADKAQRRFFHLSRGVPAPCWEPPIDVFENDGELSILVALPGVSDKDLEVSLERGDLVVRARRTLPDGIAQGSVRRLEIPQGRFERRIALESGRYELVERAMVDGCLRLRLRKIF